MEEYTYPVDRPERTVPHAGTARVEVRPRVTRQTILGMGFEIQSDSIASGNNGLPDDTTSVPHDLTRSERDRLAEQMLRGFRYCRIAGGLYWRGVGSDGRTLAPRWPEQLLEIRELLTRARVDGVSLENWSPPAYWKANRRLHGFPHGGPKDPENRLRCFGSHWKDDTEYRGDTERFLSDFARANVADIATLEAAGIPVSMWALNNEPNVNTPYSSCHYEPDEWARTFAAVAPEVRAAYPDVSIIGDCADHTARYLHRFETLYPQLVHLVDFTVLHTIGYRSDTVVPMVREVRAKLAKNRPIFQNEYEYLTDPASADRCLNIVNNIMNWFQLADAPSWFWIHALKPVTNSEASGYSLGYWMPAVGIPDDLRDTLPAALADLQPGTWTWNPHNWNAVAGFIRHLPWDSVVVEVHEETPDSDARVLAFRRPDGRLTIVASNHTGADLSVAIDSGRRTGVFRGYRYTPDDAGHAAMGVAIGTSSGPRWTSTLPDRSWEFWVEDLQ
ncbi:MAG: hypothetical protein EA382_02775 [Spirochaetaceae bacterium]|nr:MAG: hypothetical protein EA382_02775 [Spirochaetaceae bacterium]